MNLSRRRVFSRAARMAVPLMAALLMWQAASPTAKAVSSTIVISQVFGGGGNSGSTFRNDFIELFNRGAASVNVTGWSVQYASAAGTTWAPTLLSGSIAPGQHYLIQQAAGGAGTTNLPTPEATGTTNLAAGAGKVALVNTTTALTGSGCPFAASVVDFVGYGSTATCSEGSVAPGPSNTTNSTQRAVNGCTDTDSNSTDFALAAANPRNTASAFTPCGGPTPTNPSGTGAANPVLLNPGAATLLTLAVSPGQNPTSSGLAVTANLSSIGAAASQTFFDNGTNGDVTAGDNVFSFQTAVGASTGLKTLPVAMTDAESRSGSASISLTVQDPAAIVISQVYGGGGNTGAAFKNDFVELFNRSSAPVTLTNWSVQYTSSAGTSWQKTDIVAAVIGPGQYYLVQEAQGNGGTINLSPDAIGVIPMSATGGKVALVKDSTLLTTSGCPFASSVVDFVGYGSGATCFEGTGATAAPSNTRSVLRAFGGCSDTNNNAGDFATGTPNPRNTSYPSNDCSAPPPPPIAIDQIQGSGTSSLLAGQIVTTQGVVAGLRFNNGFFIQTPDDSSDNDGDPNTSEGIFVFTGTPIPAGIAVGHFVQVRGTVQEFQGDVNSPPATEIGGSPIVTVISTGNQLPLPKTLTAADTDPAGPIEQLERFEGMRVHVDSLTAIAPTQGNVNEPNASSSSTGVFYGVITGVARPFREPGIEVPDLLPAGAPAGVPRFDANPERLRIDSDGQVGAINKWDVAAGDVLTNITGPLGYSFRTYTILPDPGSPAFLTSQAAIPVPAQAAVEFTVASANLERFFDTVANSSAPVLSATAFANRLNKASLMIRNVLRSPDIIGVEEVENLTTLQSLADKINDDSVTAGDPNPQYHAYLEEGNDIGGIDSGFLVKSTRVHVIDVTQEGKNETFDFDVPPSPLNDRPPLILRATVAKPNGQPYAVTVIVNHLRSLSGVDDPSTGNRVRLKRRAQAEFLANLIQQRQTGDPNERIISVGDYNAFQFNDGYVDSIGTIKGTPTPADQVVLASGDLVNPDLVDLVDLASPEERHSFSFDGNAQELDHVMVTQNLLVHGLRYGRNNGDFPEVLRNDPNRSERISDHDPIVAYFGFPADQAPHADAGADTQVDADGSCHATVTLVGTGSGDPDGDPLSYSWSGAFGTATGATPSVTLPLGANAITLTVDDGFGGIASASVTVTVVDHAAPLITLSGANPLTHEGATAFSDPGAFALDACTGPVAVVASGRVNTAAVGSYTLMYTANDGHGNTATTTRTVNVVDTTAPVVTLNGPTALTGECPGAFVELGATATDSVAGSLPVQISGTADITVPGVYTITYSAFDGFNTGTATRTVTVADTASPTITLSGANPLNIEALSAFADPGATAVDACAGNLPVTTGGSVNASVPGSYTLRYSTSDGRGNSASAKRTVNVVDTTPPVVTLNGSNSITVECAGGFVDPGATALDSVAGPLPLLVSGSVNLAVPGDYTLTYTANDGYNTGTATRTVHVVDTIPPTLSKPTATPNLLWPPNGRMVLVTVHYDSSDCSSASCSLTVMSDEPVSGPGHGHAGPDWEIVDAHHVRLRAERAGRGDGRIYTISVTCRDASGNTISRTTTVVVPHDRCEERGHDRDRDHDHDRDDDRDADRGRGRERDRDGDRRDR